MWANHPIRSVRQHMALLEAAVGDYAQALWAATAPSLLRWVRRMLRELRPSLRLLLETRAFDEADAMANLIHQLSSTLEPPGADEHAAGRGGMSASPHLATALNGLAQKITLQYGLLDSDPRAARLHASFQAQLEANIGSHWRSLTDPATL